MDIFYILNDPLFYMFIIIGIISFVAYIPIKRKEERIRAIEAAFPEFLKAMSRHIKSGKSLQSALSEASRIRTDALGYDLSIMLKHMEEGMPFNEAMRGFAYHTESRFIRKVSDLLAISYESGASITTVLDKISGELWDAYMLKQERLTETSMLAKYVLWGSVAFTPCLVGFLIATFGGLGFIDPNLVNELIWSLAIYLIALGFCATIMYGIITMNLRTELLKMPGYLAISYTCFKIISAFQLFTISGQMIAFAIPF